MICAEQLQDWRSRALRLEAEVGKAILGQPDTIRLINVALFARGHVLLEGDVGVGKPRFSVPSLAPSAERSSASRVP